MPESFCTHQNASSVEFLETGLISGDGGVSFGWRGIGKHLSWKEVP